MTEVQSHGGYTVEFDSDDVETTRLLMWRDTQSIEPNKFMKK